MAPFAESKVQKRTISKLEVISKKAFKPLKEVWSEEVKEFFAQSEGRQTLAEQVLAKMRRHLSPESLQIKMVF